MTLLQEALTLASRGWWIFPLYPAAKTPLTKNGFHAASNDRKRIRQWWTAAPTANIGLVPGQSGLLVIDIDGPEAERRAVALGIDLDSTLAARTGRAEGGLHLYFEKPDFDVGNATLGEGIDVRCDKGYVVAPPSVHPSGRRYEWIERPIAALPRAVVELLASHLYEQPRSDSVLPRADGKMTVGGRNNMLTSFAGGLRRYGADETQLLASLRAVNEQMCDPPLALREVTAIARSVARYPADPSKCPHEAPTDMGNARRLAILFGDSLRFVLGLGWLWWDGTRWVPTTRGEEHQAAKATARSIHEEARLADEKVRKRLEHWAIMSESAPKLRAMLHVAESESEVRYTTEDFDNDPNCLCVKNGVVDLATGAFSPPARDIMCTMQCGVDYEPAAGAPIWSGFISQVLNGDVDLISFAQRVLGYCLTGSTREQCFFVLFGSGANGKSTLLETVMFVMGDYATAADFSLLTSKPGTGPSDGIARLRGKRVVTAVEAAEGTRFNEALLKQLTGGDTITARHLYQAAFSFRPSFKMCLATNYKPRIGGTDDGIWRRVKLLFFGVQIPERDRDPDLAEKLRAEGSGILNWMLRGAAEWKRGGLAEPTSVTNATAGYRGEQDSIGAFISEQCDLGPMYVTETNELYRAYVSFCTENDRPAMSQERFGKQLKRLGIEKCRGPQGETLRRGIGLRGIM